MNDVFLDNVVFYPYIDDDLSAKFECANECALDFAVVSITSPSSTRGNALDPVLGEN